MEHNDDENTSCSSIIVRTFKPFSLLFNGFEPFDASFDGFKSSLDFPDCFISTTLFSLLFESLLIFVNPNTVNVTRHNYNWSLY